MYLISAGAYKQKRAWHILAILFHHDWLIWLSNQNEELHFPQFFEREYLSFTEKNLPLFMSLCLTFLAQDCETPPF